eukprot:m.277169 g.277169  ORF g.277169 m.277169 type:complete len:51 (+) comp86747_c0_seq1:2-154(+)
MALGSDTRFQIPPPPPLFQSVSVFGCDILLAQSSMRACVQICTRTYFFSI